MLSYSAHALVFDLDGVLVDSSVSVDRQWWAWVTANGLMERAANISYHGRRTIDTLRTFLDEDTAEREAAVIEAAEQRDLDGVSEVPGAKALLQSLPPTAWAIATSGPRELAIARLKHVGLPVPSILITAEDVRDGKPAPDVYMRAVERLAISPGNAIAVEDAPAGIESAKAAGLHVIGLATTHDAAELTSADVVIARIEQIEVHVDAAGLLNVSFR
jgi:mannitol-1-/sugar-/sorbitol-6-phosphatase